MRFDNLDKKIRVFENAADFCVLPSMKYKEGEIGSKESTAGRSDLLERVIYRCIIGLQAYGLADSESDIDRRGFYVPFAELHWSKCLGKRQRSGG